MEKFQLINSRTQTSLGNAIRHFVLGWDGSTQEAVRLLINAGSQVVIVAEARPAGAPKDTGFVQGRPGDSEILRCAGIEKADGVLVALPATEARAALSAVKKLNPRARLVASMQETDSSPSLLAAGADKTVDARQEAGREMVRLMLTGAPEARKSGG